MANNMWDKRYAQDEYVYGKEPNTFFKEQIAKLRHGTVLLPADGEGRNAVFAARLGWNVTAFDSSVVARKKAMKLAEEAKLKINYFVDTLEAVLLPENSFDLLGLFYVHTMNRRENHRKMISFLKPKGIIFLEAFSKRQFSKNTGGPKKIEMLFSVEELKEDFKFLSELKVWEEERHLAEGQFHAGTAHVIRLVGSR